MGIFTWLLANPKTFASILLALLLIGATGFVVYKWEDTKLQLKTAQDALSQAQADLLVEKSAAAAAIKAAADLKAQAEQAAQAVADAHRQTADAQKDAQDVIASTLQASQADHACADPTRLPLALVVAVDRLYGSPSANGGSAGRESGQGDGSARVLGLSPIARGSRPIIEVHPSGR